MSLIHCGSSNRLALRKTHHSGNRKASTANIHTKYTVIKRNPSIAIISLMQLDKSSALYCVNLYLNTIKIKVR